MYGDKVGYPIVLTAAWNSPTSWTLTCVFLDPGYRVPKIPKAKWPWKGVEKILPILKALATYTEIRASPAVLSIWHFALKSGKEKSTNSADLVQENSFSPTHFLSLFRLVKKGGKAVHLVEKSVINMNRPVLGVLDWPFTMIGPGGWY